MAWLCTALSPLTPLADGMAAAAFAAIVIAALLHFVAVAVRLRRG